MTLLLLAVVVLVAGLLAGLERLAAVAHSTAVAEAVADVTALAAAGGGSTSAQLVAAAAGAEALDVVVLDDGTVVVTVERAGMRRRAAARLELIGDAERHDQVGS